MIIQIKCWKCKSIHTIEVDEEGFRKWQNGELIQKALPDLNVECREMLISQICGECFNEIFREKD